MDYQDIDNLLNKSVELSKYKEKRWVIIHDETRGNYDQPFVKYNCKTVADKLVDYSKGYILITGTISSTAAATPLVAGNNIAFKNGSNSIIKSATVRLNNNEVDQNHHVYITTTYLNLLEYSGDYSRNAQQFGFVADDVLIAAAANQFRKTITLTGIRAGVFEFCLKLPLTYLSSFFRRLNFPIINNELDLELELRGNNSLLRPQGVHEAKVDITKTELYLPIVELPSDYEKRFLTMLSSSYTKELKWEHMDVHIIHGVRGRFDRLITPSLNGVRKMYVMAVLTNRWNSQEFSDTASDTAINNINIEIDSKNYFDRDIRNEHVAYTYLQECFNMGGTDFNTGSMISYKDFRNLYRLYAFDLSHQKVFESDPRKSQSIRLKCEVPDNDHVLVVVLSQQKLTEICMSDSSKTHTV